MSAPSKRGYDGASEAAPRQRSLPEHAPEAFAARLRALIGRQSVLSFSRACGVTESVLRSYLHDGRMPSLDRALAIAGAAGVSVDWLASGRGPRAMAEVRAAYPIGGGDASAADEAARPPLDAALLQSVLKAVCTELGSSGSPERIAALTIERYRQAIDSGSPG